MALYWNNGKEVIGGIVSKAVFALGKKDAVNNSKTCSKDYWERTIRRLVEIKYPETTEKEIQRAIELYDELVF